MELDGIFLDLYGTLTTGDRAAVEAVCGEIVCDCGVATSARALSIAWGERFFRYLDCSEGSGFQTLFDVEIVTLIETMAPFGVDIDARPYAERLREYWRDPPLQEEVGSFFEAFDCPVCIVSNADRSDAEAVVSAHRLPVAHLVTSEDARSYKPHRVIFEMALARTGWRRDRVMHVGDSLHSDVGGAMAAGIRSGWVNRAQRIHDIGSHEPDHEFADLHELAALVGGRRGG
jgi:2-haloacid dehalogenase/putative hydrolase of the HAD superfamily